MQIKTAIVHPNPLLSYRDVLSASTEKCFPSNSCEYKYFWMKKISVVVRDIETNPQPDSDRIVLVCSDLLLMSRFPYKMSAKNL